MIVDLQRKIKLETEPYKAFVNELRSSVPESNGGVFSVAFVSDRRMKDLNKFFRGKDSTTDVLSFPHEPDDFETSHSAGFTAAGELPSEEGDSAFLGDIVISVEQAERQANENRLTFDEEVKQLILHGLLHLCGYDHESDKGEMDARELELRTELEL